MCAIFAFAVTVAIFLLTEQSPADTVSMSGWTESWLASTLQGTPLAYDSSTGLWMGTDIRHWAHTVEFFALGVFVSFACAFATRPGRLGLGLVAALAICLACSLIDQCHKLFVPGRHFDVLDLGMDALGYMAAMAIVFAAFFAAGKLKDRFAAL